MSVTSAELQALLEYCPDTGMFHWRRTGKLAGNTSGDAGYRRIGIKGRIYLAHRLALLYVSGELPDEVDHINGNRLDNRLCNLRAATRSENASNVGLSRANRSGHRGVSWSARKRKWLVQVGARGRVVTRYADDLEVAAQIAQSLRAELHNEFNRTI